MTIVQFFLTIIQYFLTIVQWIIQKKSVILQHIFEYHVWIVRVPRLDRVINESSIVEKKIFIIINPYIISLMKKIFKTVLACCLVAVCAGMQSCKPREIEPEYVGQFVDLGLSVKWAQTNVGAVMREDAGCFFAWGEVTPKESYTDENYKWMDPHGRLTKYCTSSYLGVPDGLTILEPADDAATMALGDGWRTPTKEELQELINKCTWTWSVLNGCYGYEVRSNVKGFTDKYIFLPAGGRYLDRENDALNYFGYYWTSECPDLSHQDPQKDKPVESAYLLGFQIASFGWSMTSRVMGCPIRPVYTK